jgi:MOSC domain
MTMPHDRAPKTLPKRKLLGQIVSVLTTSAQDRMGFQSTSCPSLELDLEGIVANRHRGWTRKADARVPYLKRGTIMRNDRHLSLVSVEDLAEMARRLDLERIEPSWIGANIVVSGLPQFSFLPRGTHLFTTGGAVLTVTDQNDPCTLSGAAIAAQCPARPEVKLNFPKLAHGLRGVVAVVEHAGQVAVGSELTVRVPSQWIYG